MNHENNVATASGKTDNMPKDYIYCPAADGACPRAPQCLRAIAADIRRRIMACFSCRSYYFQSRKGERLITPKEQQAIANVFRQAGLKAEPEFDNYVEETYW